ncbi:MAG: NADH-quinone oxidoreductase subunit N [Gaiellales bacterium]
MLAEIVTPKVDWFALSPALAPLAAAGLALLTAVLVPESVRRGVAALTTIAGFGAALGLAIAVNEKTDGPISLIAESMSRDKLGAAVQILLAVIGIVVVLISLGDGRRDHVGEYYALLAVSVSGMIFFVTASNLMTMFLGLEWFSIPLYILCALDTHRRASLESGLKYLIVGSFGSGILLFGCALAYGASGELGYVAIRNTPSADTALFAASMALVLTGLAFKVSAAPFHMWTPDVYQGAPTAITALMSAATKAAALVVTLRVLVTVYPEQSELWTIALAVLIIASLVIGNLGALAQTDLKRLLAYSSISHAGFALMAIAANSALGAQALLYYLVPYTAGSLGALAVVAARERELGRPVTIDALSGLGWERPLHGAAMWVFMLGFAGFPLTGGFLGKLYVFLAIDRAGWWWLVVIGVLATALSLAYYLKVIRVMYMREAPALAGAGVVIAAGGSGRRDNGLDGAILIAAVVTIGSFFLAQPVIDVVRDAASSLLF